MARKGTRFGGISNDPDRYVRRGDVGRAPPSGTAYAETGRTRTERDFREARIDEAGYVHFGQRAGPGEAG